MPARHDGSGHLRNLLALSEMGAIVAPPVPGFYARPETVDDIVDHTVRRVLDLFGLDSGKVARWGENGGGRIRAIPGAKDPAAG